MMLWFGWFADVFISYAPFSVSCALCLHVSGPGMQVGSVAWVKAGLPPPLSDWGRRLVLVTGMQPPSSEGMPPLYRIVLIDPRATSEERDGDVNVNAAALTLVDKPSEEPRVRDMARSLLQVVLSDPLTGSGPAVAAQNETCRCLRLLATESTPHRTDEVPKWLMEGTIVKIHGLRKSVQYNNMYALVGSSQCLGEGGRVTVSLLKFDGSDVYPPQPPFLKLKPTNMAMVIEPLPDDEQRKQAGSFGLLVGRQSMDQMQPASEHVQETMNCLAILSNTAEPIWPANHPRQSSDRPSEAKAHRCFQAAKRQGCANCGAKEGPSIKLLACSKCKSVAFCSKECLAKAWSNGHKEECKTIRDEHRAIDAASRRGYPCLPMEYKSPPPEETMCPICHEDASKAPFPLLAGCGCDRSSGTRFHLDCLVKTAFAAVEGGRLSLTRAFTTCTLCKLPFSGTVGCAMKNVAVTSANITSNSPNSPLSMTRGHEANRDLVVERLRHESFILRTKMMDYKVEDAEEVADKLLRGATWLLGHTPTQAPAEWQIDTFRTFKYSKQFYAALERPSKMYMLTTITDLKESLTTWGRSDPEVLRVIQSEILDLVALLWLHIGAPHEALAACELALDTASSNNVAHSHATAEIWRNKACIHLRLGDNDNAIAALKEEAKIYETLYAPSHPAVADTNEKLDGLLK